MWENSSNVVLADARRTIGRSYIRIHLHLLGVRVFAELHIRSTTPYA